MADKKASITGDLAYTAFFLLLFVCLAFSIYAEDTAFNIAALCVIFAVLIVTRFTTVTLGLILNIIVIFAGFSWYLYLSVSYGSPIRQEFYFWAVMGPALTAVSHTVFRSMSRLEEENAALLKRVRQYSVIDDETKLKNLQAYEMEFPVYQRIAERYQLGLMLILWQFRYADDLERMLGKSSMKETAAELSRVMSSVFRKEDVVYIISKNPYEWGSLLLSREDSEELLKARIKEKMEELDLSDILRKNAPKLEVRVGVHFIREKDETALTMLKKAEHSLQYDV